MPKYLIMRSKILQFIFFGNYFVGLLAVALSIETALQNNLPFNTPAFYLLLFIAPILYYTYAYTGNLSVSNPRSQWYFKYRSFINQSQRVLSILSFCLIARLIILYFHNILNLPLTYWLSFIVIVLIGVSYYGMIPNTAFKINLRNTGWLKAFVIGFMWATCTSYLPIIMLKIETGVQYHDPLLWAWFFIKNWMFCTVNAIIFDIKDYPSDANRHLKTVVVRLGLRRTIFYFLIPLLLVGMVSLFIFATYRGFGPLTIAFNTLPFVMTLYVVYSMRKRKNILYYLVIIDGLVLLKAICGIIGALVMKR